MVALDPPDLAVVDIRMPLSHNAGLLAAERIRERYQGKVRVLVLSQYLEPDSALRLLGAGVDGVGYLLKDRIAESSELIDGARRVAEGGSAIDPPPRSSTSWNCNRNPMTIAASWPYSPISTKAPEATVRSCAAR